jgi:hypothetical protein
MEKALEKLAEQVLSFDEASLTNLREKYRLRIEHFDGTKDLLHNRGAGNRV